ncbi:MAG: PAS domain-containing protein [Myxococcales bacterium]|nr:PAS domain-containing protein [Myxococcales bacterium]
MFGLLFETSPDAAFIVDRATGCVVSANVRAADMLSVATDALLGVHLSDLVLDPERDITQPGRYEDLVLRGGDDYPVYVTMQVAHIETLEHGELAAYMARDTSERRLLECEVMAKHSALFTAHAELERAHAQLTETKAELENRNHEIAMLAWRAAMGELVAGIAHHLNNPVGALASTVRRLKQIVAKLPPEVRPELEHLLPRIDQIARRIESNVAAIVSASRANAVDQIGSRTELPPELASVLTTFADRLDDIPTKESV